MKKLSLNDVDYYFNLVKKMKNTFDLYDWIDADTDNYPIQLKLYYFIISKILKELRISPKLYKFNMPCFNQDSILHGYARDEMGSLGEISLELVNGIYAAYGWDVKHYWMDVLYLDVCYELDIDLSDIEGVSNDEIMSKFKGGFTNKRIKEFLGDDYELLDELILGFVEYFADYSLKTTDLYVYRNKKLGKYLSYVSEHPSYSKTPIGARIKKIMRYDLNPNQFFIPPYKISGLIDKGDFVMSNYFFCAYETGEYVNEAHIQLDRVVLVILLDKLLDMAYKELNLSKEVA